ncbi:MAG: HEAT repeat domain-containing protein [Planctomycetes bacterium]|nr:HEAT repeat domain-containing protein [Planctomycetota bacterium]
MCRRSGAVLAVLLAACAGTSTPPFRPAALSAEQAELCRAAEQAYRGRAPDYESLRQRAAADPTTAVWLTRMFIRDVFTVREGRPLGEDQGLLRAAARIADPVETRAIAEIEALGAAAVPTLVGDLLCHGQPQPRELGIELLAHVGAPAVPAVQQLATSSDARQRRAAARTLGAIGVAGDVLPTLRRLAADADFAVRADALRDLHDGGAPVRDLLVERLGHDDDAFVRRTAAQSLQHFPGAAAANALIDYLERCKRERDYRGEEAAQASLQVFAGTHGPRTPAAWRAFAATLTDSDGGTELEGTHG